MLCAAWMLYTTRVSVILQWEKFTAEDFVMWYYKQTFYLTVGSFLSMAGMVISIIMCAIALYRRQDGQFIVRTGIVILVVYMIPFITFTIYQRSLFISYYPLLGIIMIACGKRWEHYLLAPSVQSVFQANPNWPFVQEFRTYLRMREEEADLEYMKFCEEENAKQKK